MLNIDSISNILRESVKYCQYFKNTDSILEILVFLTLKYSEKGEKGRTKR